MQPTQLKDEFFFHSVRKNFAFCVESRCENILEKYFAYLPAQFARGWKTHRMDKKLLELNGVSHKVESECMLGIPVL